MYGQYGAVATASFISIRVKLVRVALLLALVAGAPGALANVVMPQSLKASCEPSVLADHVAHLCVPNISTDKCCEPVVVLVDSIVLGGGVSCLCLMATVPQLAYPGLNLLALYTACGGSPLAAAACQGGIVGSFPAPPTTTITSSPPQHPGPANPSSSTPSVNVRMSAGDRAIDVSMEGIFSVLAFIAVSAVGYYFRDAIKTCFRTETDAQGTPASSVVGVV